MLAVVAAAACLLLVVSFNSEAPLAPLNRNASDPDPSPELGAQNLEGATDSLLVRRNGNEDGFIAVKLVDADTGSALSGAELLVADRGRLIVPAKAHFAATADVEGIVRVPLACREASRRPIVLVGSHTGYQTKVEPFSDDMSDLVEMHLRKGRKYEARVVSLVSGLPIKDAVVVLTNVSMPLSIRRASEEALLSGDEGCQVLHAASDVHGRVIIEGVPPGRYGIGVFHDDYVYNGGLEDIVITIPRPRDEIRMAPIVGFAIHPSGDKILASRVEIPGADARSVVEAFLRRPSAALAKAFPKSMVALAAPATKEAAVSMQARVDVFFAHWGWQSLTIPMRPVGELTESRPLVAPGRREAGAGSFVMRALDAHGRSIVGGRVVLLKSRDGRVTRWSALGETVELPAGEYDVNLVGWLEEYTVGAVQVEDGKCCEPVVKLREEGARLCRLLIETYDGFRCPDYNVSVRGENGRRIEALNCVAEEVTVLVPVGRTEFAVYSFGLSGKVTVDVDVGEEPLMVRVTLERPGR